MTSESAISPVPMPDGYRRCMEISKGFTRAGIEAGGEIRTTLIHFWLAALIISFAFIIFQILKVLDSEVFEWSTAFAFFVLFLVHMYFNTYHSWPQTFLNWIYYKIDVHLQPYLVDGENILVTLYIAPGKVMRFEGNKRVRGLFILTTHRCFLITTSAQGSLEKEIFRTNMVVIDVIDYSSAASLLPPADLSIFKGGFYAKRLSVKPVGSGDFEEWDIMPTDSNNFLLLEAILARRDRIQ